MVLIIFRKKNINKNEGVKDDKNIANRKILG